MNGSYYQNPTFPAVSADYENKASISHEEVYFTEKPAASEMVYEEREQKKFNSLNMLLKQNKGKLLKVKTQVTQEQDADVSGVIESVGDDYIVVSNPQSGSWMVLPMTIINFFEFSEKIDLDL